jgi:hypothetical protein
VKAAAVAAAATAEDKLRRQFFYDRKCNDKVLFRDDSPVEGFVFFSIYFIMD